MARPVMNLAGQRFGRLVVTSLAHGGLHAYWLALCDCGRSVTVRGTHLKSGSVRSCGCLIRDTSRRTCMNNRPGLRHGNALRGHLSPEYRAWLQMKKRCFDPNCIGYKNWGGRGITVCQRWMMFENFLVDIGRKPHPSLSLDRINNDGNYEPGNCRWATRGQQARNTRRSRSMEEN